MGQGKPQTLWEGGRRAKSGTQWQVRRWNELIRVGTPPTRSFQAILGDLVGLDGHFWIGYHTKCRKMGASRLETVIILAEKIKSHLPDHFSYLPDQRKKIYISIYLPGGYR